MHIRNTFPPGVALAGTEPRTGLRLGAATIAAACLVLILLAAAYGAAPMPVVPQVTTLYGTVLVITEGTTAFLLFNVAVLSRRREPLVLGGAYLFSSIMAGLHLLAFPGALLPPGSWLSGSAVSVLFLTWRLAFPVCVIAMLLPRLLGGTTDAELPRPRRAVVHACACTLLAIGATLLGCLAGWNLPTQSTPTAHFVAWDSVCLWLACALHVSAFLLLVATRRQRDLLDGRLSLALIGFAAELFLYADGNARFSLGWYAGRVIGMMAALALFLLFLTRYAAQNRALASALASAEERADALQTEIRRREDAEARLIQSRKLEALGQLTGGVAHDFNNLLTAILGSLRLLAERLPKADRQVTRLFENAIQGAERGAVLTQRLLAFGRRQALKPAPVQLDQLVSGMADLIRSSLGAGVELALDVPPDLPPAFVDPNQLELALLNLATNARDAMRTDRRLTIAAHEAHLPAIDGATGPAPGGYVVLSVADRGEGMDEATLARATEPFFTTKDVGKGTGLGLSMVHGLAAQSGGQLVLRSRKGEGTTVELWLPLAPTRPVPA